MDVTPSAGRPVSELRSAMDDLAKRPGLWAHVAVPSGTRPQRIQGNIYMMAQRAGYKIATKIHFTDGRAAVVSFRVKSCPEVNRCPEHPACGHTSPSSSPPDAA